MAKFEKHVQNAHEKIRTALEAYKRGDYTIVEYDLIPVAIRTEEL